MRIGVNCGHTVSGQPGCGAVGYIDESVEVRRVGKSLMRLLSNAGHSVFDCTNDYASSTSENLVSIVAMADRQPLDLFVSIHFNSGGGKGCEVFTYGGKSFDEANNVCEQLSALGFVNRGIKDGSSLYVIRRSQAKAMLIEVCFVDSESDTLQYNKLGPDVIAQSICRAIIGESDEEEIDMEKLSELENAVKDLSGKIDKLTPMVYNYVDENMPGWAIPTVLKLMDSDILQGNENGELGLTYDILRMLVMLDRSGVFDK